MRSPASEVLGAGPIAAPTATPRASIPAASIAMARGEGRRGGPGARGEGRPGGPGELGGPGGLGAGGVGVSGVVVKGLVGWGASGLGSAGEVARRTHLHHKIAYIDQGNEEYGRFVPVTLSIT